MEVRRAGDASLDELVQYVTLHVQNPIILTGVVLPFGILYAIAFYLWFVVYGVVEHYEAGIICLAAIIFVHILTSLFCFWSVHVLTFLNCHKVSEWNRKCRVTEGWTQAGRTALHPSVQGALS